MWKSNEVSNGNGMDEPREQSIGSQSKGFTTRSFSMLDSPLRGPQDALGVINNPEDADLLRTEDFAKSFENLDGAMNATPTRMWLIGETTILVCCSLTVAFLTQSVMVVWAIVGSSVSFIIAFTLPGLFYLKIRFHKGWTLRNV